MKTFSYKMTIVVFFLILLAVISLVVYSGRQSQGIPINSQPPLVIYVPGWKNKGVPQEEQKNILHSIYPDSRVIVKNWDSDGDFEICKNRADQYVEILANEIAAMEQIEHCNIILIGHSLGGRIAVKTVAALQGKKIHIRRGIFLGAAIPDNAPEIEQAITSTIEPCINVHNKEDYVLRHIYSVLGDGLTDALGSYGYSKVFYGVHLLQFEIKSSKMPAVSWDEYKEKIGNHNVRQYLMKLSEIEKSLPKSNSASSAFLLRNLLPGGSWAVYDECCNWKFRVQKLTSSSHIENQYGDLVFCGNKENSMIYWKQLSTKYTQTAQEEIDKIQVLQDKKNPVIKVVPLGWENVDAIKDWRLQRKKVPFRGMVYRIIDPKDFQRANGEKQKMLDAFNYIKEQCERIEHE